jgi:hypothetical protein
MHVSIETTSNIELRIFEKILVHLGSLIAVTTYETLKYFEAVLDKV